MFGAELEIHIGVSHSNYFAVFYSTTNNICGSVEEFALEHFRSSADLPEGLHAEGAVFNTLCAVLFWTVITSRCKIWKYISVF